MTDGWRQWVTGEEWPTKSERTNELQWTICHGGLNQGSVTGGLKKQAMRPKIGGISRGAGPTVALLAQRATKKEVDHVRGYINANPNPNPGSDSMLLTLDI